VSTARLRSNSTLAADLADIPVRAAVDMHETVSANAAEGNKTAQAFAKESAGVHGKHYPKSFSVDELGPLEREYGPDSSKPQGDMSFEHGSRNQKPHLDLNRSADIQGPKFARDVAALPDRWFW
jgi:hypothetical protein